MVIALADFFVYTGRMDKQIRNEKAANDVLAQGRVIPSWQKPAPVRVSPKKENWMLRYAKSIIGVK